MNLYAITPDFSPETPEMHLYQTDEQALEAAVYTAAHDAVSGHGSPTASVYCIARDIEFVGKAVATDAPRDWEWAHPGVEENHADQVCFEIECDLRKETGKWLT